MVNDNSAETNKALVAIIPAKDAKRFLPPSPRNKKLAKGSSKTNIGYNGFKRYVLVLIFHLICIFHINGTIRTVEVNNNGNCHGSFCSCNGNDK